MVKTTIHEREWPESVFKGSRIVPGADTILLLDYPCFFMPRQIAVLLVIATFLGERLFKLLFVPRICPVGGILGVSGGLWGHF